MNAKLNGKIAIRTLSYFVITSLFNAILGVILVVIIHPGNIDLKDDLSDSAHELDERKNTLLDNFLDLGRNIIPSNIFAALFQQVISYSVDARTMSYTSTTPHTNFECRRPKQWQPKWWKENGPTIIQLSNEK